MKHACRFTSFVWILSLFASAALARHSAGQVEKIAEGFQFVEGPVWKNKVGLLFSDIPANTVYRIRPDYTTVNDTGDNGASGMSCGLCQNYPNPFRKYFW